MDNLLKANWQDGTCWHCGKNVLVTERGYVSKSECAICDAYGDTYTQLCADCFEVALFGGGLSAAFHATPA